jgi:pimeloyl-ACP methyl ester carboxylesterase
MAQFPSYLHVEQIGEGPALVLMHGAGEDSSLLTPQAAAFARRGFTAISYDRRGTGRSTREGWPGGGMRQHVEDAADLIRSTVDGPARVLGFSSGGVIALALAVRHPDLVAEAIAWEPAAVGVLPDADALHELIMGPAYAYLAAHPDDWAGAYDLMLMAMSGGEADLGDPTVAAMRRNAEAAVRDDAEVITRHRFRPDELEAVPAVVAVGSGVAELLAAVAERLGNLMGRPVWTVPGIDDHEVYLHQPDVLAEAVASRLHLLKSS